MKKSIMSRIIGAAAAAVMTLTLAGPVIDTASA